MYTTYERPTADYYQEMKATAYRHLALAMLIAGVITGAIVFLDVPIWVYYIGLAVEFMVIIGLFIAALMRKQFSESTALAILNIFAVASGITLGFMVKVYLAIDPMIVFYGFGTSGVVIFGIYTYTSINKPNVSHLYKYMLVLVLAFLVLAIFGFIFMSNNWLFNLAISVFGAAIFALYMYIDFARLERGEFYSPAMMALMLFYDIIFFIKYMLRIAALILAGDR